MTALWKLAADHLRERLTFQPQFGIILGTGLHQLAEEIAIAQEFDYADIPHFPISTVESHAGKLLVGTLAGKQVMAMKGRFHAYEGYSYEQVALPVRVMKSLGVETLFVSNAAGALNPSFRQCDIMLINDHINLHPTNPLIGPNDEALGTRFPDMSAPYDKSLCALFRAKAAALKIDLKEGVYASVQGPMLETRAEYRFLRRIGADAVGMSTVPEIIAARHLNMRCAALSVLTDECDPDNLHPVDIETIIAAANKADSTLSKLFSAVIGSL